MSYIYTAEGEPMMTAAELALESELDALSAMERAEEGFYGDLWDDGFTDEDEDNYDLSGSYDDAVGPDEMEDAWLDGSYEE